MNKIVRSSCVAISSAALALTVGACSPASGSSGSKGSTTQSAASSSSTTPSVGSSATAAAATLSKQDRTYVDTSAQGDRWEVLGGQLALKNSTNPAVRAFGQRMITDHTKSYHEVSTTASSLGLTAPTSPESTQEKLLKLLATVRGNRFDCTYLAAEYEDHTADISDAQMEADSGQSTKIKQLASQDVPTLQQHLSMAESDLNKLTSCS